MILLFCLLFVNIFCEFYKLSVPCQNPTGIEYYKTETCITSSIANTTSTRWDVPSEGDYVLSNIYSGPICFGEILSGDPLEYSATGLCEDLGYKGEVVTSININGCTGTCTAYYLESSDGCNEADLIRYTVDTTTTEGCEEVSCKNEGYYFSKTTCGSCIIKGISLFIVYAVVLLFI